MPDRGNTKQPVGETILESNRMPPEVLRNPIDEIYGYTCKKKTQTHCMCGTSSSQYKMFYPLPVCSIC